MSEGELLKDSKDKKVTMSKDFVGAINNNSYEN